MSKCMLTFEFIRLNLVCAYAKIYFPIVWFQRVVEVPLRAKNVDIFGFLSSVT